MADLSLAQVAADRAANYGADRHGLIGAWRLRPDRPAEALDGDIALALLAAPPESGSFLWLHVNLAHAGAAAWLSDGDVLPDDLFDMGRDGSRSARISRHGERLLAVLNDVTFDFSFDPQDVATLWVSLAQHVVISARYHPLRAVDRLREAVKRGEPVPTPMALLEHLLGDQADELQHIVRTASDRVDDIEDALLAGRREVAHAAELARLRRLAVRLQRLLAPEPAALMRVLANPPGWILADDLDRLRRVQEEFAVVLRDVAALQDRVKLLQDEAAAYVAEQNNRSLFILTMVTVLALPINLVAGLLGMNVGGIPLAQHDHGFALVLLVIGVFTALVATLALRRLRPQRAR